MKLRITSATGPLESRVGEAIKRFPKELATRLRTELPWRSTAEGALRSVATPSEAWVVEAMLGGLKVEPVPAFGATAVLPRPDAGLETDAAVQDAGGRPRSGEDAEDRRRRIQGGELSSALQFGDAEAAVRAWVNAPFTSREDPASGKDINAVDLERGPEPIEGTVQALLRILGLVPISPAEQASTERAAAAVRLQARIEAFVEAQGSGSGSTSKARIQALADAVVAAWTAMVRDEVPRLARSLMVSLLSPGSLSLGSAATGGSKA